ncbi:Neurotransmitter-gated ion-channel ligand binding domain protein [Aphelenchoides fujianensis]|nr:Neurotransmitter-gated ion-channel ligand binding domain protein [Aphelenchoides fujianensis]
MLRSLSTQSLILLLFLGISLAVPPYHFYHTVESKNGQPFAFRNLKIKFESTDVVSGDEAEDEQRRADAERTEFYDVQLDGNEADGAVGQRADGSSIDFVRFPPTESPVLQIPTIPPPAPAVSATTHNWQPFEETPVRPNAHEKIVFSTGLLGPKYSLKAWVSATKDHPPSTLQEDDEAVEYPTNDEIPGLKELLQLTHLVVPHRIRHSHSNKKAERRLFVEQNGLQDDEDYADAFYSTTALPPDTKEGERTTVMQEETTALPPTTTESTAEEEEEVANSTAIVKNRPQTALSPEDERIFAFFGLFFESQEDDDYVVDAANETVDQFVLTAREILHADALGRPEEELRELLTNVTNLEVEVGNAHRDHGASFILPVLKAVEYDNNSVPVVFPDIPVNVRVALNVIHLGNFDSMDMEYSIDLEMHMSWFDVRLANNYTKPIRIREKEILDLIWRPDPYFVNSKFSYFHIVSFPNFRMRVMPTGLVQYTLRVTLLPVCLMTFCRHPHDHQQCDLKISSIAYPRSFVNFTWHSDPVHYNTQMLLPELRIKRLFTESCRVEGKLILSSCLRLGIQLERDGARYIAEKYIPSMLAMMFAWVAPYVPYNYEDVRIITPITVLLTLVQMEKGEAEIHTSYLTSMDIWFVAMKAFSVMSLVESLAVLALIKRARGVVGFFTLEVEMG